MRAQRTAVAILLLIMASTLVVPPAYAGQGAQGHPAQERGHHGLNGPKRPHEPRAMHRPRRTHPADSTVVHKLPTRYAVVREGRHYHHADGFWYRRNEAYVVVARPPRGTVVPLLPPHYVTIYYYGRPYYYANYVYYQAVPRGYVVIESPRTITTEVFDENAIIEEPIVEDFTHDDEDILAP
jgi:hypothetical protein